MTRMAKAESARNFSNYVFAASSPACYMYQSLADRETEMSILAGNGLSRRICFDAAAFASSKAQGMWVGAFSSDNVIQQRFDAKTRPR